MASAKKNKKCWICFTPKHGTVPNIDQSPSPVPLPGPRWVHKNLSELKVTRNSSAMAVRNSSGDRSWAEDADGEKKISRPGRSLFCRGAKRGFLMKRKDTGRFFCPAELSSELQHRC